MNKKLTWEDCTERLGWDDGAPIYDYFYVAGDCFQICVDDSDNPPQLYWLASDEMCEHIQFKQDMSKEDMIDFANEFQNLLDKYTIPHKQSL